MNARATDIPADGTWSKTFPQLSSGRSISEGVNGSQPPGYPCRRLCGAQIGVLSEIFARRLTTDVTHSPCSMAAREFPNTGDSHDHQRQNALARPVVVVVRPTFCQV